MNSQDIESVAHSACFSTDPQIKNEAQLYFMNFTFNLHINQYNEILQNYSQTVLFVFFSYLNKKIPKANNQLEIFMSLKQHAKFWYQPNGELHRSTENQPLKNYIVNTLHMVLGTCMKYIFMSESNKKHLLSMLNSEQNKRFKLFLYKSLLEITSLMDPQQSYISTRTFLDSFQSQIMPQIISFITPFFIQISECLQIHQLSQLQLNQNQSFVLEIFNNQDKIIGQMVFFVLAEIMNFKYNFTIDQYDADKEFQNCLLAFPDSLINHITTKQFLEALYYIINKLTFIYYKFVGTHSLRGTYIDSYFNVVYQCLKKILLSKIDKSQQSKYQLFIHIHYQGLYMLTKMINTQQIGQQFLTINKQKVLYQVFQSTIKFIHCIEFDVLEKQNINYIQWILLIRDISIKVIQNVQINTQNRLFQTTSNLIVKIAAETLGYSQEKYLPIYQEVCRTFFKVFFNTLIDRNVNIMGNLNIVKVNELLTLMSDFYLNILKIGSMDMINMLEIICLRTDEVLCSNNSQQITNLILLLTQIMRQSFYQRNIFYQTYSNESLNLIGYLIHRLVQFINFYKSQPKQLLLDIAILRFNQRLLSQCLQNVSLERSQTLTQPVTVVIKSRTFKLICGYKQIQNQHQEFLLYFFMQLIDTVQRSNNRSYDNILIVEYALNALSVLLLKLKWIAKRELFMETKIANKILFKTIQLSKNALMGSLAQLRQRRKLFKLISFFSFDDLLDSYRQNLTSICQCIQNDYLFAISQSCQTKHLLLAKILFDISGIAQNIQTSSIYRNFLVKIDSRIGLQKLLQLFYQTFGGQSQMLLETIELNRILIMDKSLRMFNKQITVFVYDIVDYTMPFLTTLLQTLKGEAYSDQLMQTYKLVNVIIDSSYINISLVKRKNKFNFLDFIYKLLENVLFNQTWIYAFPQLTNQYHSLNKNVLTNCSQIIISLDERDLMQLSQSILYLFDNYIILSMGICISQIQKCQQSGKMAIKQLSKTQQYLTCLTKLYLLIRNLQNYSHRIKMSFTIKNLIQNKSSKILLLQSLYRLGMSNIKNHSQIFQPLCQLIGALTYFYNTQYIHLFRTLGIDQCKITKYQKFHHYIQDEDNLINFVANLKDWIHQAQTDYQPDIQY